MRSLGVNPISLPDFTPLTRYVLTYIFRKGARAKWTHVRLTLMDRPGGLPGLYSRLRLKIHRSAATTLTYICMCKYVGSRHQV